jgi:hypothetical protein
VVRSVGATVEIVESVHFQSLAVPSQLPETRALVESSLEKDKRDRLVTAFS